MVVVVVVVVVVGVVVSSVGVYTEEEGDRRFGAVATTGAGAGEGELQPWSWSRGKTLQGFTSQYMIRGLSYQEQEEN